MSDRVDILERFYEAWNGPDPAADTLPFLHEEFEYVNPESAVEPGTRHGHGGWLKVTESADKAFSHMSLEPYETIETGDRLLVLTIFRACGRDSGAGGPALRNLLQTAFNEGAPHDRCPERPPCGPAVVRLLLLLAI